MRKKSISQQNKAATLIQAYYRRKICMLELKRRKKMVAKRRNVSKEILSTEQEYVANIEILVESFLRPLQNEDNRKQVDEIMLKEFAASLSGIEVILQFHRSLLADLEKAVEAWSTSTNLGELFERVALYLKFYSQYVTHYQTVVQLLAKRKTDKNLQNLLESLKPSTRGGKGIKDYMIMPIQRIPRYQMLLQELIKSTWNEHSDYSNLTIAHKRVKIVAETLENQSADALSITKVMELAGSFQSDSSNFKLVVPHRRYIADEEGMFSNDNSVITVRIFLFNDIILIGKPKKDKFKIIGKATLASDNSTANFDVPPPPGKLSSLQSEILMAVKSPEGVIRFVIPHAKEKRWRKNILALLDGDRIWLPHEEKKKDHGSIINVSREESTFILPTKKKGLFSTFFSRREDKKGKEKEKETNKEPFPVSESDSLIAQDIQTTLRAPIIRSTSFESQELKISPGRKAQRAKSAIGHAATDTEGISAIFEEDNEANEEQSVPLDDDEDDNARKPKQRKVRKTKSIRISVDATDPILRDSKEKETLKRKRKKHRTTDLSKLSKSSIPPVDDFPEPDLREDQSRSLSARSKKRTAFRKSMQNSLSEHSKSSPYAETLKSKVAEA